MPALHPDDPRDEGPLADLTSGGMWLAAGTVGLIALTLPGSDREHMGWALAIAVLSLGWGAASLVLWRARWTMSIAVRATVTAATSPVVAAVLWATGGTTSFIQPLLVLTVLFVAYFFPPRLAWPLVGLFTLVYATPLVYDPAAHEYAYPARSLTFAVAIAGATAAMQMLKRRLLQAEARQRGMAQRDPLTGLYNRRSFDAALERSAGRAALVLFDFDGFKAINDEHGHPAGDAVLRSVSTACQQVVREDDCLARIGGDEFAVVATRGGGVAASRLVDALEQAIAGAELPAGIAGVQASFAWAVAPKDGETGAELLERADQRLLYRKRLTKFAF
jgi:diguanylate cyclase (GGDEF)-like protein